MHSDVNDIHNNVLPGANSSAADIISAVKNQQLSVSELVQGTVDRINTTSDMNMFISVASDIAEEDISAAGQKPLAGLPIAVKDNTDVVGFATTGGTPALKGWFPKQDAPAIARLKAAGAIVVGKTNMHELAAGITSDNPTFGRVANPYDANLMAGGSSGGSGAAVGAGLVSVSIGSDTAGSNRIPASLCGCVGFRPSLGRYPMDGVIPLSTTRDTLGVFSRTVPDTQMIDEIISGQALESSISGLDGIRLGIPRPYFYDNLDRDTSQVIDRALDLLASSGATLVETEVPDIAGLNTPISLALIFYEVLRDISMYLARSRCPVRPWEVVEQMGGEMEREWFKNQLWGEPVSVEEYNHILSIGRPKLLQAYQDCFASADIQALVLPTTPLPARRLSAEGTVEYNGEQVPALEIYLRNTDPTSVAGLPSITVPAGLTTSKLPVGLSFDALPGADASLLSIAAAFEAVRPEIPLP
jgi:indoleacetamide hydrolase